MFRTPSQSHVRWMCGANNISWASEGVGCPHPIFLGVEHSPGPRGQIIGLTEYSIVLKFPASESSLIDNSRVSMGRRCSTVDLDGQKYISL